MKKIGIFGGTFNPIHLGHINVAKDVKDKLDLDLIYFVPTYKTPNKNFVIDDLSPKQRYKMVHNTISKQNKNWLKVLNFEYKNKRVSYTWNTIEYLKRKFPDSELYLIIGEDRFKGLDTWENISYIKNNCKIVVYRRDKEINKKLVDNKNFIYLKDKYYDVSSTDILKNLNWSSLDSSTKKYIAKNRLYIKTIVFNNLKDTKYQHSVSVATISSQLASRNFYLNKKDLYLAGLIHDLFKYHSDSFLLKYYKDNSIENNDIKIPLPALHGFVCALWFKNEYGFKNKKILNAIKNHTLGNKNSSKPEKIVYVSDKIAADRKYKNLLSMKKLAFSNLDETYKKLIKESIELLKDKNLEPHKNTIDAYNELYKEDQKDNKFKLKINKK